MKFLTAIILLAFFTSCNTAPDRNQIMTRLINEKKIAEDSITTSANYEQFYVKKWLDAKNKGNVLLG